MISHAYTIIWLWWEPQCLCSKIATTHFFELGFQTFSIIEEPSHKVVRPWRLGDSQVIGFLIAIELTINMSRPMIACFTSHYDKGPKSACNVKKDGQLFLHSCIKYTNGVKGFVSSSQL